MIGDHEDQLKPHKVRFDWTLERINLLRKYWREGKTCSQIAALMGEGLTRNAVIGKADRLKLPKRVIAPVRRYTPEGHQTRARFRPSVPSLEQVGKVRPVPIKIELTEPVPGRVTVSELTGCKWPVAENNGVHVFCNAEKHDDRYCAFHANLSLPEKKRA